MKLFDKVANFFKKFKKTKDEPLNKTQEFLNDNQITSDTDLNTKIDMYSQQNNNSTNNSSTNNSSNKIKPKLTEEELIDIVYDEKNVKTFMEDINSDKNTLPQEKSQMELELLSEAKQITSKLLYEKWREDNSSPLLSGKSFEPAYMETQDIKWTSKYTREENGSVKVDVANTPFEDLPADIKQKFISPANAAVSIIENYREQNLILNLADPEYIQDVNLKMTQITGDASTIGDQNITTVEIAQNVITSLDLKNEALHYFDDSVNLNSDNNNSRNAKTKETLYLSPSTRAIMAEAMGKKTYLENPEYLAKTKENERTIAFIISLEHSYSNIDKDSITKFQQIKNDPEKMKLYQDAYKLIEKYTPDVILTNEFEGQNKTLGEKHFKTVENYVEASTKYKDTIAATFTGETGRIGESGLWEAYNEPEARYDYQNARTELNESAYGSKIKNSITNDTIDKINNIKTVSESEQNKIKNEIIEDFNEKAKDTEKIKKVETVYNNPETINKNFYEKRLNNSEIELSNIKLKAVNTMNRYTSPNITITKTQTQTESESKSKNNVQYGD